VPGRAETIVRSALPTAEIDRVVFDMTPDREDGGARARAASHRRAAETIAPWLDAGETVAFVTLGDPNLYSTFPAVVDVLNGVRPGTSVRTVPGICAFQDLASRAGVVLTDGSESLVLVTALEGTAELKGALDDPNRSVVLYKGGRHLPEVAGLLAQRGRLDGAVLGELLGLPGERILRVADAPEAPAGYLATLIVPPVSRVRSSSGGMHP
jgi:precorrin-2/cobalt-factor-2 C20-methyltransferase